MEQLVQLGNQVKETYIDLILNDLKAWVKEKNLAITEVSFDIQPSEADFWIKRANATIEGQQVRGDFRFKGYNSPEYQLFKKWESILEELQQLVSTRTDIYEEESQLVYLLRHLEDFSFDLQAKGQ